MKKLKKIKNLKRSVDGTRFRGYLSANGLIGTEAETIDQINNNLIKYSLF